MSIEMHVTPHTQTVHPGDLVLFEITFSGVAVGSQQYLHVIDTSRGNSASLNNSFYDQVVIIPPSAYQYWCRIQPDAPTGAYAIEFSLEEIARPTSGSAEKRADPPIL